MYACMVLQFFFWLTSNNIHAEKCSRVQDAYTMRCVPQVHGIVNDTIKFVKGVLVTEMNSALDNPVSLNNIPCSALANLKGLMHQLNSPTYTVWQTKV